MKGNEREKYEYTKIWECFFFFEITYKEIYPIYIIPRKKGCNYINYSEKNYEIQWESQISHLQNMKFHSRVFPSFS
jgi:hypothetical protein